MQRYTPFTPQQPPHIISAYRQKPHHSSTPLSNYPVIKNLQHHKSDDIPFPSRFPPSCHWSRLVTPAYSDQLGPIRHFHLSFYHTFHSAAHLQHADTAATIYRIRFLTDRFSGCMLLSSSSSHTASSPLHSRTPPHRHPNILPITLLRHVRSIQSRS